MRPIVPDVRLRDVTAADLPFFFEQQQDADAMRMVAFTGKDPHDWDAFLAKWANILGNGAIIKRTILCDGQVAGNVVCFEHFGKPSVGYWLGKEYWGRGVATRALTAFLGDVKMRPLYAGVVKDNAASLRVLEKCGFAVVGEDRAYSNARGTEVEEILLELRAAEG